MADASVDWSRPRTPIRGPSPEPRDRALGPFGLIRAIRQNPIECWTKAHFEQPIVEGGFPFARVIVVSDPAAIRQALVENAAHYQKSRLEQRILSAWLHDGLVAVEGAQWHRQRRTLAPLLGRKMVNRFTGEMAHAVARLVERWAGNPDGTVLDIKEEMSGLALEALLRCLFSDGLGDDQGALQADLTRFFAVAGRIDPFDVIGLPKAIPRITLRPAQPLLRTFDRALTDAIGRRLANPDTGRTDMLSVMLGARDPQTGECMSETEVKANVLTAIFAGQETTSTALSWALYLLSQTPDWIAPVAAEAQHLSDTAPEALADRMTRTRAVIQEAMRLYPPIVGITRTVSHPTEVAGRALRPGTMLIVSPYVLHRHRLLWNDPDVFDPGRFLDGATRPIERYAYLPFGVGPRMCIGAAFALQEMTVALATITRDFRLSLAPGEVVWPVQRFTLRPRDGLRMVVERARKS